MIPNPAYVFPHAAVASPHYLATIAGVNVLSAGGNAVDAAIATNLVLAVVCPHLCGAGGDLFAIVHSDGNVIGLNSSGRLPMAAELPGDGKVPVHGIGSVTVPGAAAGWVALAERYGTRDINDLAKPAIGYAREGFCPSPSLVRSTERSAQLLERDRDAKRIWVEGVQRGWVTNPELADVLSDLRGFYHGDVARNAPAPCTPDDFARHEAEWVTPMSTEFFGDTIYEMPPNSRGHLVLKALDKLGDIEGMSLDDPALHRRMFDAIESVSLTGDTVYLCAQDRSGLAISMNESNYMGYGSGVVVPGTGVHLHNRGAYHTPASYKGAARPIHTLAPGMATRGGKPHLLFGTMGGEAQIQIHMQLLVRLLAVGQD
ncbi:MAG: gamma-glutamyltransferase, partial [Actinomycetota bacterium]